MGSKTSQKHLTVADKKVTWLIFEKSKISQNRAKNQPTAIMGTVKRVRVTFFKRKSKE